MATLYRKYRPQNFKEVVGQNHIKVTLQNEVQTGKIAQAYIFCGPRAVGKTTLARVLAKTVNCEARKAGDYEPCNKCSICEEITSGRSLDIIEIDAASHTGVDNVRENIITSARVAPSRNKYKVFIIDEVHMLSISAFNALLKIIEEPPEFVIFILCTTEIHKVPTTIISRCERFDFKRISVSDSVAKLKYIASQENIKIDKEILESIARHSEGYQRDAEGILGQIVAIGGKIITQADADLVIPRSDLAEILNLIDLLNKKDSAKAVGLINHLVDEGVDLKKFATDLIEVLRKIMLSKISPVLAENLGLAAGEAFELKINEISKSMDLVNSINYIEKFIEVKNSLKNQFIIQLPFELAITRICLALDVKTKPSSVAEASNITALTQEKKSENQEPVISSSGNSDINIKEVSSRWSEVLARVKKHNHSLSFILRVCRPREIDGNKLCLAFKYKFHKDRISDLSIKAIVEKVINEVFGRAMTIEPIIDESLEIDSKELVDNSAPIQTPEKVKKDQVKTAGNMMDNLLETFKGKVVK